MALKAGDPKAMKQSFTIAQSQVTRETSETSAGPDKKVSYVMKLFADGPQEYDFLLKILSLGRDKYWRDSIVQKAEPRPGSAFLDIACGTGLVTYSFARTGSYAVGIDVTREMLTRATQLPEYRIYDVDFILARAENLPLRSDIFDASTISLALRNVSSQVETLNEMKRCTKRGKSVMSLDFARPKGRFFSPFYRFYIFRVLPILGLLISKHWNTIFLYLANSIEKSRDPERIKETMDSIGLNDSEVKRMTEGTTALVSGIK
jgi:demethylmenaquinone methyltransferase / 2-methoxy-6-polyprenyl-1,4-benzoquinol methylase